ncbi:hypothetical protein IWX92DRAFT_370471 [Phyllosticta citricarpa]
MVRAGRVLSVRRVTTRAPRARAGPAQFSIEDGLSPSGRHPVRVASCDLSEMERGFVVVVGLGVVHVHIADRGSVVGLGKRVHGIRAGGGDGLVVIIGLINLHGINGEVLVSHCFRIGPVLDVGLFGHIEHFAPATRRVSASAAPEWESRLP